MTHKRHLKIQPPVRLRKHKKQPPKAASAQTVCIFKSALSSHFETGANNQAFYWNARDLEQKLASFRDYFNAVQVHQGLSGDTPAEKVGGSGLPLASLLNYRWQSHCHGLVQLPIAA
jgi:hypothetical protein